MAIQPALARLAEGGDLDRESAAAAFRDVMTGAATSAQIAALLTALRLKGETAEEVAGAAETMRALSTKVEVDVDHLVDTCGTGGSGAKLFNISTAGAFVTAAAGAHVAKHGNRAMTSSSGSADALEALGVNIALDPTQVARCIETVGMGFMFAQAHHSAMRHAAPVRKELGFRTLMNVLGPMTNPAGAARQVIGVFARQWQRRVAQALAVLGAEHVLVVHSGGLDEIGLEAPTHCVELRGGEITEYEITPADFGIALGSAAELKVDSVDESVALVRRALTDPDARAAEIVALNAGAAIYTSGVATSLAHGVEMAQDAIASGLAKERLDELVRVSSLIAET